MLNIYALSQAELRKRKNFRCIHRHHGLSHSHCYDQANGIIEKIGFLDIESTNLKSSFGIVLSYCILGDELSKRIITPEEIRSGIFDKSLLEQFCQDIRNFNRVITWNGLWFDLPFLRTRCDLYSLDFPVFREILHTDALVLARKVYATLHSKRLGEVCKFFGIESKDHPLTPNIWLRCLSGNQEALDYVGIHNEEDVRSLKRLWGQKLEKHTKLTKTSI